MTGEPDFWIDATMVPAVDCSATFGGRLFHMRRSPIYLFAATILICVASAHNAKAVLNAGVEAGVVKRTASAPNNLNVGFAYGAHAELTIESTFALGAYYLHSNNSMTDTPSNVDASARFETLGIRGRLILPMPGNTKPYGLVGLGHNWITYRATGVPDIKGESWEAPLGFGIAQQLLRIFQLTVEVAYRPSFSFGGQAFGDVGIRHPNDGWSLLAGAALDF
jgi:opacity protein-like surface antigen